MKSKYARIKLELAKILTFEDAPAVIALSAAIGVFWNFIPTLGLGVFISILFAKLIRVRVVIAATANICTGFLIPFFYTLNLMTGKFLTQFTIDLNTIRGELGQSLETSVSSLERIADNPSNLLWLDRFYNFSADFFIGSIVNAIVGSLLVYIVIWWIIKTRRKSKRKNVPNCVNMPN